MLESLRMGDEGPQIVFEPDRMEAVVESVRQAVTAASAGEGGEPVLVCAPTLRAAVRRMVSSQTDGLPVLSYTEAGGAGAFSIETVGVVRDATAPSVTMPAVTGLVGTATSGHHSPAGSE
jgi:flagellar biosynthesis protein FlhA